MHRKIIISGVGCCLVDMLYNNVSFNSAQVREYFSKARGDGGLSPGKLVFQEEFEKYCGKPLEQIMNQITGGRVHDSMNIGGPSIVALINIAQLVDAEKCSVNFYGCGGNDEIGKYLTSAINKTPVTLKNYAVKDNRTPSTLVLSDPSYDNGHGERSFINSIGAAWEFGPEDLDDDFFNSDIVIFGGTALVPKIHDNLTRLLERSKSKNCITVVNTVFDFRNEMLNPSAKWPMGESDESYRLIDLLITDREEASRLSGESEPEAMVNFFRNKNVSSVILTDGSKDITVYSDGRLFNMTGLKKMSVSQKILEDLASGKGGDTTGCGDNFVGGVVSSIVNQLHKGIRHPDLEEACCWGIISGGFACFYMGGTYKEEDPGEKLSKITPYYESYQRQISN